MNSLKTHNPKLISYCGLYCGECRKYKKEKCPGCTENEKASWCKIRTCCQENNFASCAECPKDKMNECKKLNNFMGKFFSFVFNSDRKAGLNKVRTEGYSAFASYMVDRSIMAMPRKKKS